MAGKKSKDRKQAASQQRIAELINKAIGGIESRLAEDQTPLSIGDYLKVLQLQKELEDEQPHEVTVTWVDPESKKEK